MADIDTPTDLCDAMLAHSVAHQNHLGWFAEIPGITPATGPHRSSAEAHAALRREVTARLGTYAEKFEALFAAAICPLTPDP